MKAYKGFNRDMTCRGFKYKEGETYITDNAKLCEYGFHACETPMDCFAYYSPAESVFHAVELDDNSERKSEDSKVVGTKIKIGAKLSVADICRLHFEYTKEKCKPSKTNVAGDGGAASAGNYGAASAGDGGAASAGYRGAASAGNRGAASAGDYGAASAGDYGAASAGDGGAASAGDYGAASAGNYGAASAGNYGAAVSRGSANAGKNGVAVVRGNGVKVKGGIGCVLIIVEENADNYDISAWNTAVVDGEKIKVETWYKLVNGEFKEAEE